jgi:membrane-associated protein|tara:strand:- start:71 stop:520 length:450 start_codon:yes stop_codon:yes gene_type:complete
MIPLLAFLEACPGIGLFVSGVILLSVSTLLYTEQIATLSQILPLAFAGACLSDHLGFYIGRVFGPKLHQTAFAQKRMTEIAKSEAFILKFGTLSVLGGRLIPAVRSLVPMMIGISGTSRLKFTLVDLAACAIWITGLGLLVVGIDSLVQ